MYLILLWALVGLIGHVHCKCSLTPIADDERSIAYACIHSDLNDLEKISSEAEWIEFSVSRFYSLHEQAFARFKNLRRLSFYNCHVSHISPDAFAGLHRLEWLIFDGTKLHVARATWFRHTPSLRRLSFNRCGLIHVEPEVFRWIPRLETLGLRDNDLDCLPVEELAHLRMLRTVRIDGNPWLCECRQRMDMFFKERSIVQEERCIATCVYGNSQCMTQIAIPILPVTLSTHELDLSERRRLSLQGNEFQTSVLSSLDRLPDKTTWIEISGLRMETIPRYTFFRFGNSLRSLDLNDCSITSIENGAFAGLHKLQRLSLTGNKFTIIQTDWFRDLVALQQLILRGNEIEQIERTAFWDLSESLRHLDLRDNRLRCIRIEELAELKKLERLDATGNPWSCSCRHNLQSFLTGRNVGYEISAGTCQEDAIVTPEMDDRQRQTHIEPGSLGRVHWTSFEQSIKELNTTIARPRPQPNVEVHVHTPPPVYKGSCYPEKSDSQLFYICTGISSIEELNVIPKTARTIRVNLSNLGKIPANAFARFNGYLSRLELRDCGIHQIHDAAFAGLYNLERLSLHGNQLDSITTGTFQGLQNLRDLDLSRNNIYRIANTFDQMPYLRSLDVSENSMNCIGIEHIARRLAYLTVFRVANNPWSCLCGTKLAEFLDSRRISYDRQALLERNEECYETGIPTVASTVTSPTTVTTPLTSPEPETVEGSCTPYEGTRYRCVGGNLPLLQLIPADATGIELQEGNLPYLPAGCFSKFTELRELTIRNSGLRTIEEGAFDGLEKLVNLTIQDNPVESVSSNCFVLENLERLDLRGNSIRYIAPGAFQHLNRVVYVNLEGNDLRCIYTSDLNDMPDVHVVEFSGNPLKWRCRVELEQFLETRKIKFVRVENSCEGKKLVRNLLYENRTDVQEISRAPGIFGVDRPPILLPVLICCLTWIY